jgi:DNA mismatch repair protein MutL
MARDDLEGVATLGFRGEALASIASVAKVSISTRTADAENGSRIDVDGASEAHVAPAAHPRGTTVDVSDLFYNTPARRKFLKTERTELAHLNDIVTRLALARLDVEFETRNGTSIQHLAPSEADGLRRVAQLLGAGFAAACCADRRRARRVAPARMGRAADAFSRAGGSAVVSSSTVAR